MLIEGIKAEIKRRQRAKLARSYGFASALDFDPSDRKYYKMKDFNEAKQAYAEQFENFKSKAKKLPVEEIIGNLKSFKWGDFLVLEPLKASEIKDIVLNLSQDFEIKLSYLVKPENWAGPVDLSAVLIKSGESFKTKIYSPVPMSGTYLYFEDTKSEQFFEDFGLTAPDGLSVLTRGNLDSTPSAVKIPYFESHMHTEKNNPYLQQTVSPYDMGVCQEKIEHYPYVKPLLCKFFDEKEQKIYLSLLRHFLKQQEERAIKSINLLPEKK